MDSREKTPDQLPEHPEFWEKRFREGTTPWDAGRVPADVQRFAASSGALPTLVPGCGSAWEAGYFDRLGWPVTALDFSPAAVDAARDVQDGR